MTTVAQHPGIAGRTYIGKPPSHGRQIRQSRDGWRPVRVVCDHEHCGCRLDVLYAPPGRPEQQPRDRARPEHIRTHSRRYRCDRCGTNHEVRVERLDAAYAAAASASKKDRAIRLPLR